MPSLHCNNILIVRTDRIGDVVLTTPVFKALRAAYPGARISVLVTPLTAELLEGNPYIDEVFVDDRKGRHKGVVGFLQLARDIRARQFDTAFVFHTKRRSNMACYLAGVPQRVGYKNEKYGFLLTHPAVDTRHLGQKHEAEYCLDLLKSVGIRDDGMDMMIVCSKQADAWAGDWFEGNNVNPGQVIAIHAGASDPAKCWPKENFAKLIDHLSTRYSHKIVLIGGPDARQLSTQIMALSRGQVIDMAGKTTVGQMAALLRRSRILVSNDSGPVHVGAGVGIPVISLFVRNQPGINPERWRPLGLNAHILTDTPSVDQVLERMEEIFVKDSQSLFYW